MPNWQAFLLGAMAVLTPSVLVLSLILWPRSPSVDEVPDAPSDDAGPYRR
jgi:hypothetical protein